MNKKTKHRISIWICIFRRITQCSISPKCGFFGVKLVACALRFVAEAGNKRKWNNGHSAKLRNCWLIVFIDMVINFSTTTLIWRNYTTIGTSKKCRMNGRVILFLWQASCLWQVSVRGLTSWRACSASLGTKENVYNRQSHKPTTPLSSNIDK